MFSSNNLLITQYGVASRSAPWLTPSSLQPETCFRFSFSSSSSFSSPLQPTGPLFLFAMFLGAH